jgi:hypothetical protein
VATRVQVTEVHSLQQLTLTSLTASDRTSAAWPQGITP